MAEKKVVLTVKQDEEKPIAAEIMAKAIIDIDMAAKKLFAAGLKREALVALIHWQSGVGKPDIRLVLDNLDYLRARCLTK